VSWAHQCQTAFFSWVQLVSQGFERSGWLQRLVDGNPSWIGVSPD